MQLLETIDKRLSKAEAVMIGLLLLFMSAVAFLQVITRYCFFHSLVWSEEISRYCMVWLTFIGASLAVSKQEHINIDLFSKQLNNFCRFDFRLILNILILIFLVCCIFYGINLVISTYEGVQMTPAIGFPMFIVYLIVVLALIAAAFHAAVRIILFFSGEKKA